MKKMGNCFDNQHISCIMRTGNSGGEQEPAKTGSAENSEQSEEPKENPSYDPNRV